MSKEVATTSQEAELAALTGNIDSFGQEQSAQDIVMPKLLVMQPGSKLVTDGIAKFGEFRNSLTHDLLGSIENELEVVPITIQKTFTISKKLDGRWQYFGIEPVAYASEQRPYEEIIDGVETKNELTYNLYCLIGDDALPYCVSLKGMSSRAGKSAFTHMYVTNYQLKKILPFTHRLILSGKKTQNDKGTFVTLSIRPTVEAEMEEKIAAANWCKVLQEQEVKTDDSDVRPAPKVDSDANEMQY